MLSVCRCDVSDVLFCPVMLVSVYNCTGFVDASSVEWLLVLSCFV